MAIHRVYIREGDTPPAWAIAEAERASKLPINFDDIPPLTDEELKQFAALARERRSALRKNDSIIRVPHQTLDKAKKLLGDDYTSVLRRLIVKAVDHPEMLQDCL